MVIAAELDPQLAVRTVVWCTVELTVCVRRQVTHDAQERVAVIIDTIRVDLVADKRVHQSGVTADSQQDITGNGLAAVTICRFITMTDDGIAVGRVCSSDSQVTVRSDVDGSAVIATGRPPRGRVEHMQNCRFQR